MANTEKTGRRMQDICHEILQNCANTTQERRKQYGGDVFLEAAKIATAISSFGMTYTEEMVHEIFIGMKLARYNFQLSLCIEEQQEAVIEDSLKDLLVYIALYEGKRKAKDELRAQQKTGAGSTNVQFGDRQA